MAYLGARLAADADGTSRDLIDTMRRLIEVVIVRPGAAKGEIAIELRGRLAELTGGAFPHGIKGGLDQW
jgi:hypothetical protein